MAASSDGGSFAGPPLTLTLSRMRGEGADQNAGRESAAYPAIRDAG